MKWDEDEALGGTNVPATVLVLAGATAAWITTGVVASALTLLHAVIDRSRSLPGTPQGEEL